MLRVSILIAMVVALKADITEEMYKDNCEKLFHSVVGSDKCCKTGSAFLDVEALSDAVNDCGQLAPGLPDCELEKCIAMKRGLASDDGVIQKSWVQDMIQKNYTGFPADQIAGDCVESDVSIYGDNDECEHHKIQKCIFVQLIVNCPGWDETSACSAIKEEATKCGSIFS